MLGDRLRVGDCAYLMLAQAARLLAKQFDLLDAIKNKKPSNKINVRQPLGFIVARRCAVLN